MDNNHLINEFKNFEMSQKSSSRAVINAIINMLREGQLTVGDKLPSETQIAEAVQVGRGTVREAMKILTSMGVVEVKRGDGTYISGQVFPSMMSQLMIQLMKVNRDVNQLSQIREIIERGIVRLAIVNATDEQINDLKSAQHRLQKAVDKEDFTLERLFALEEDFHMALVRCTNNDLLEILYASIIQLYFPARYDEVSVEHHMKTATKVHPPVIQAIETRDLEEGMYAIKQTTRQWIEIFEEENK